MTTFVFQIAYGKTGKSLEGEERKRRRRRRRKKKEEEGRRRRRKKKKEDRRRKKKKKARKRNLTFHSFFKNFNDRVDNSNNETNKTYNRFKNGTQILELPLPSAFIWSLGVLATPNA